jgi:Uri superfamily endonuclease
VLKIIENSGVYILEISAQYPFTLNLRKYSGKVFRKGFYYYAGSAQKNLKQRLKRHLLKSKNIHWHIDHITTLKQTKIERIFTFNNSAKSLECLLSGEISLLSGVDIAANHFGNSDCKNCKTHLYYSRKRIDQSHFSSRYQSTVCFMPSSREIS